MIAYAKGARIFAQSKNHFDEKGQAAATSEYRRALLAPLSSAVYGSRVSCPKLVTLAKHVQHGENRVAETTVSLAFGALSLGVGIEDVCRPFRVIDSMLRAQVPAPTYSMDDLNLIESEIDGSTDPLQVRYASGDHSEKTKLEMLEKFERIEKIAGQINTQLRREIYGRVQR